MKTICTVKIKNFQRHHDLTIEFVPGVNAITGPSDAGKSSILRAIMWCLRNEPEGLSFISNGKKSCSVSVEFDDGITITRERGKAVNRYKLEGRESLTLDNFGKGVPEQIQAAIGFGPVEIGGDWFELNFAKQLESPFLLTAAASRRMNIISQLGGTGTLGEVGGGLNRDITNAGRAVSASVEMRDNYESDEVHANERAGQFELFLATSREIRDSLATLIISLKTAQDLLETNKRIDSLANLSTRVSKRLIEISESISEIEAIACRFNTLNNIKNQFMQIDLDMAAVAHIKDLRVATGVDVAHIDTDIARLAAMDELNIAWQRNTSFFKRCERAEQIRPAVAVSFADIEEMIKRYGELKSVSTALKNLITDINHREPQIQVALDQLIASGIEIRTFIAKQKICPICEKPFDVKDVERLAG